MEKCFYCKNKEKVGEILRGQKFCEKCKKEYTEVAEKDNPAPLLNFKTCWVLDQETEIREGYWQVVKERYLPSYLQVANVFVLINRCGGLYTVYLGDGEKLDLIFDLDYV